MNYVVLAIPVFVALILLELLIARVQEKAYYSLADSINDLSCGILQQLLEVFIKTGLFAGYLFLFQRYRVFEVPIGSVVGWVLCFLGLDLLYYWFHRSSHEINAFWAAHVVHHQSEEYNLAVALRQGALQSSFSWVYYLPLAVLGFPPAMFLTVSSVDTLYQFWIHTRAIGKLGPLEWVLNTPSNHRVHHGRNPRYIDRNHGGILIVWDRLFGTFEPEGEEVVYGITTPLSSWNPVWANLHYWVELWGKARRTARIGDKIRMFLKPPGWQPQDLGGYQSAPEVDPATVKKFDTAAPAAVKLYVLVQFGFVFLAGACFMFRQDQWAPTTRYAAAGLIALSMVTCGGLLDSRRWAFPLEGVRMLLCLALLGFQAAPYSGLAPVVSVVLAGLSLLWLSRCRRVVAETGA